MTDPGSTQFPATTQAALQAAQNKPAEARTVELTRLPEDLREVREQIRLRGEVVQRNNDGSVRVRTERGEVDIKPPADQPPPRDGQRVDIEIQPGNPPREARIQKAPAQTIQNTQAKTPDTQAARTSATPVSVEVTNAQTSQQTPTPSQTLTLAQLPQTGANIRLELISPEQAAQLITASTPQALSAQLTAPVTFQAELIALEAQLSTQTLQPITTTQATLQTTAAPAPSPQPQLPSQLQSIQVSTLGTFAPQTTDFNALPSPLPQQTEAPLITFAPKSTKAPISMMTLKGLSLFSNKPVATLPKGLSLQPPPLPKATPLPALPLTQFTPPAPGLISEIPGAPQTPLMIKVTAITPPQVEIVAPKLEILAPDTPATKTPPLAEKIADIAKPDMPAPQPIVENAAPGSLRTTLEGVTAAKLPILSFTSPLTGQVQNFALHIPAPDIPVGTQIHVTPQSANILPEQVGTIVPSLMSFLTPGEWTLLQDVQQAAAQLSTASAQVISNITPSPANPAQFTPAALFFLSAVRSGDITGWLGDKTVDLLRRSGRGNLLSRLGAENGLLSRLAAEPVSQDWRAMALPLMWKEDMHKITLFYKREENASEEQDGQKSTRFIFDLNLSHMGAVQVDGLFRRARLDVILRTEERLSEPMQMQMRRTYADALRQTEVSGELSFQDNPKQWVKINVNEDRSESVVA
ncbi:MAG: hypothetical protein KDJ35_02195 [Alphaproteobacteria bacterium]|nr:hypothetical protein [Alphaproteobacteria bacterium]